MPITGDQFGEWLSFGGIGAPLLALLLVAVAAVFAWLAARLPLPLAARRPGRAVAAFMLLAWGLAIATFLVGVGIYRQQLAVDHLVGSPPANPIGIVTYPAVVLTFVVLYYRTRSRGAGVAFFSAVTGALAAPLIFELPFDLITMGRTYPPIPPDPWLYRAVFFVPLVGVEVTTFSLLTLSPLVRLRRSTLRLLALMFLVFAVWALFGFGYPASPATIGLNIASKLVAFAAALTLFLPMAEPEPGPDTDPDGGAEPSPPDLRPR